MIWCKFEHYRMSGSYGYGLCSECQEDSSLRILITAVFSPIPELGVTHQPSYQFLRMLPFQQKFPYLGILWRIHTRRVCYQLQEYSHKRLHIVSPEPFFTKIYQVPKTQGIGLCTLDILMLDHQLSIFMTFSGVYFQFQPTRKILRMHLQHL